MNRKVGRPQGGPRGSTQQANALAEFLLTLTAGMTVRELAARYHVGKTLWSEYRSGLKLIPLELLTKLVQDHAPDERTRHGHLETATRLYAAALEAGQREPVPAAPPPLPSPTAATVTEAEIAEAAVTEAAVMEPAASLEPPAAPGAATTRRRRPRPLFLVGGGTAIAVLTVLALLLGWGSPGGDAVFAVGQGGDGVFRWDGTNAAGWTRIGDGAKRLHSGPAGLFATGTDDRLYRYEGRPGRWSLISELGGDFAVSGAHVFRLAADRQSVAVWNGHGTSWTTIGGPAVRLYGGEPGLFATDPEAGWIFRYSGRPFAWDRVGTAGASFALTNRHLYGLTPERALVNRWLSDDPSAPWPPWTYAAGPAAELYGGPAGLFSTDPSRARLRVLTDLTTGLAGQSWQDIGPAGAEVVVGREAVFVLTEDRSRILRWSADSGTWQHIGGPAQTLTAG
ncbi:hypothetical protein AB0F17_50540 [Nonomuraea sp. NPDC026600]|uniref:hypothetical protein n=1 Tax=Nonomuraea sp. NPDC026600 TaxID=3155363 RepID=UPI00340167B5